MVSLFNIKVGSLTRHVLMLSLVGMVSSVGFALPAAAETAPKVRFVTTEGDFTVEVYPDKAPKTVENFLRYVKDKHYDGLIFHRVINNFMVQGGGYDAKYTEKPTRPPVIHEGREALAKGGSKNVVGTLAMARTNDPNSASSQFFINVKDNANLDAPNPDGHGYTVFGKVVSGTEVVDRIRAVRTTSQGRMQNVPVDPITIQSATIVAK